MISNDEYVKIKRVIDNTINGKSYNNMLSEKEYYLIMSYFRSSYKVDKDSRMFITTQETIYYNDDTHYDMTTKYKPFNKKLEKVLVQDGCLEITKTNNEYSKYSMSYCDFIYLISDGRIHLSDGTCSKEEMDKYISDKNITYVEREIVAEPSKQIQKYITRETKEYKLFVQSTLERDNYTCQCCDSKLNPEVHHILNYASHKDLRIDLSNSITLCECCHSAMIKGSYHNEFGTRNNNSEQLQFYINNKRSELGLEQKTI